MLAVILSYDDGNPSSDSNDKGSAFSIDNSFRLLQTLKSSAIFNVCGQDSITETVVRRCFVKQRDGTCDLKVTAWFQFPLRICRYRPEMKEDDQLTGSYRQTSWKGLGDCTKHSNSGCTIHCLDTVSRRLLPYLSIQINTHPSLTITQIVRISDR